MNPFYYSCLKFLIVMGTITAGVFLLWVIAILIAAIIRVTNR